jgi:quinol monooxygenase YgiN
MPTLAINNDLIAVIDLFSTQPEQQQELIDILIDNASTIKQQPGFVSTSIHQSQDGVRVACYSQWQNQVDYESFINSIGQQFNAKLATFPAPDSHVYEIAVSQSKPGTNVPPKITKGGFLTHFAEFRMQPENQARLVELEKEYIVKSFEENEGLVSANFHRSLDGTRTINYGQWVNQEAFESILKAPGFEIGIGYWVGLAENEFHLYDVIFTLPAE